MKNANDVELDENKQKISEDTRAFIPNFLLINSSSLLPSDLPDKKYPKNISSAKENPTEAKISNLQREK